MSYILSRTNSRPAYPHHAVMWSSLPQNVEFGNEMWSFNAAQRGPRIRLKSVLTHGPHFLSIRTKYEFQHVR